MSGFASAAMAHAAKDTRVGECVPSHYDDRPGDIDDELMWALLEFIDPYVEGVKSGRYGELPRSHPRVERERLRLAKRVDDLHAMGGWWPRMGKHSPGDPDTFVFCPNVTYITDQRRESPDRPERGYCVWWTGMFWAPCGTPKRRREHGYVPMSMCWPPPKPKAGHYISSGARAKFIYRICEVEPFKPPRGAKKFTCRLWCERVLPEDVPAGIVHHTFYWHPRKRRAA